MPDRRRRQSTDDSNPFAPPPEDRPEQPWQPRHPGNGKGGNGEEGEGNGENGPTPPSGQWSPRQPGRSSGGWGGGSQGGDGPGGQGGGTPQLRWDPTDPAQRRARYALLSGMWGFFFAVFDFPELALLLGTLALYWGVSSLRSRGRSSGNGADEAVRQDAAGAGAVRSQTTAAVSGIITASLALVIVAATFTMQLVYRDFYTCVEDALTRDGQVSCNELLPEPLRDVIGVKP